MANPLLEASSQRFAAPGNFGPIAKKALAQIRLAFIGLPTIDEMGAYRLFLAGVALEKGVEPRDLMKALGFPRDLEKYNPDQPRVPAGTGRESGQWTSGGDTPETQSPPTVTLATSKNVQVAQNVTCSAFIAQNCKGLIMREFPSQYLDLSVDQLLQDAQGGVQAAIKGRKLLFDNRFRK
jgi:hypothetical protein